ncbi:MAG: hypothetical protein JJ892_08780 [Balneola sp.]|nr:hypothetical protein [Balneola sp.]MBO6650250.1 hypothetical protein [Balneola sp.]MBO6712165.1 hypothetical protein [Balneola sp.]MBO6800359.1 hypothetical protein [Balneola sp.]MBO6871849.1 hypothetical protein [Balneola sp.]
MSEKCIYCGNLEELTRDHIPPKNLFPKPRPSNLITVPCCKPCNNSFSLDDEYMQVMFSLKYNVHEKETVKRNWPKILRNLSRIESDGFYQSIMNGVKDFDVKTKSGVHLGKISTYEIDYKRITNVSDRIVQGLYFETKNNILPSEYHISSYLLEQIDFDDKLRNLFEKFFQLLSTATEIRIGETFSYRIKEMDFDPNTCLFYFSIYNEFNFFGMTSKESYS